MARTRKRKSSLKAPVKRVKTDYSSKKKKKRVTWGFIKKYASRHPIQAGAGVVGVAALAFLVGAYVAAGETAMAIATVRSASLSWTYLMNVLDEAALVFARLTGVSRAQAAAAIAPVAQAMEVDSGYVGGAVVRPNVPVIQAITGFSDAPVSGVTTLAVPEAGLPGSTGLFSEVPRGAAVGSPMRGIIPIRGGTPSTVSTASMSASPARGASSSPSWWRQQGILSRPPSWSSLSNESLRRPSPVYGVGSIRSIASRSRSPGSSLGTRSGEYLTPPRGSRAGTPYSLRTLPGERLATPGRSRFYMTPTRIPRSPRGVVRPGTTPDIYDRAYEIIRGLPRRRFGYRSAFNNY